jgi:hypothetical protein
MKMKGILLELVKIDFNAKLYDLWFHRACEVIFVRILDFFLLSHTLKITLEMIILECWDFQCSYDWLKWGLYVNYVIGRILNLKIFKF